MEKSSGMQTAMSDREQSGLLVRYILLLDIPEWGTVRELRSLECRYNDSRRVLLQKAREVGRS